MKYLLFILLLIGCSSPPEKKINNIFIKPNKVSIMECDCGVEEPHIHFYQTTVYCLGCLEYPIENHPHVIPWKQ